MPEGAEVRLYAEFLAKSLSGRSVQAVEVISGRYVKSPVEGLDELRASLPRRVVGGGCHGKFLYIILEDGGSLQSTLGMSGGWHAAPSKHERVRLVTDAGAVHFNDARNFGTLKFAPDPGSLVAKLKSLGPDVMHLTDPRPYVEALRRKAGWNVCKALMDQSVVAGIGNYVKAEALWRAEISPWRPVSDLSDHETNMLLLAARDVLKESYELQGASFRTYKTAKDDEGGFSEFFNVYGRSQDSLGNDVSRDTTPDGRTTFWSPTKQR